MTRAQSAEPVMLKSALIYNLMRYVNWPEQETLTFYTVAVIADAPAIVNELSHATEFVKVKGKPVKVIQVNINNLTPDNIQLLFVDKNNKGLIPSLAKKVRQSDTLLVTEESSAKQDFMINIFPVENKYKFEVNSSNIIYEGLTLHKDILLLGGSQLDVAKLLRSSEDSLHQARLEIDQNKSVLAGQQHKIEQYQANLLDLQKSTAKHQKISNSLKAKLDKQTKEFINQQQKLKVLSAETTAISTQLAKSLTDLSKRKVAYQKTTDELMKNQWHVHKLEEEISKNSAILSAQEEAIKSQHNEIALKDNQISFHQYLLSALAITLFVFLVMTAAVYFSFKGKKQATQNLLHSRKNIKIIGQLGLDITACLDFNQAMAALQGHIQDLMDTSIFTIGLLNEETQTIDYNIAFENGIRYKPYSRSLDDKNQFAVYSLEQNINIFINNIDEEYKTYLDTYKPIAEVTCLENGEPPIKVKSMLYIPITSKNKVKGVISVQSDRKNAYKQTDMDLLTTLAAYTSVALENSLNHEKVKQAQEQLVMQEKMASLGLLTAGVAHEINNPTNFTRLSAQNLQADLDKFKQQLIELAGGDAIDQEVSKLFEKQFEQLFEKVDIVLDGTQRIKNTVQDLRSFTRHDSGEKSVVKLNETLSSTIRLVRSKYQDNIDITHEFIDEPSLDCWPALLNQVFMNLIVNSCDAIAERLPNENKDDYRGQINITLETIDDWVFIKFSDNGMGMNKQTQQQLFEPFYTTKELGKGTGLGLSISYGIIKKHKGEISVTSEVGKGSCFTLSFPIL